MSELRQDPTTGSYVIVAPERGRRTGAPSTPPRAAARVPSFDERCPFCPGHEAELPGIIAETPAAEPPGWSVRVVPNKFPALSPEVGGQSPAHAGHATLPGHGFHEVIIDSPHHDADLATMPAAQICAAVETYHQRFSELSRRPDIEAVLLFRNHGARSGASLVHPHAQVIALPLVPPRLQALAAWGERQGAQAGHCPTCTELAGETRSGQRLVEESRHFLALVPVAAEVPCEQWLVPKRHHASFAETSAEERADLAALLANALRRLRTAYGDPPYSLAVESPGSARREAAFLHWRLRIVPDLVNWGGFERGSGMPINPSAPEADAALLRASLGADSANA